MALGFLLRWSHAVRSLRQQKDAAKWGECGTIWGVEWELSWNMAMDQYLLIAFLGEWTSIYQLFWCSPGVQGFDTLPYHQHWKMVGYQPWVFPNVRCWVYSVTLWAPDSGGESSVLALKAPKAVWQFNTLENHHVELLVINHQTKRVIYTVVIL